MANQQNDPRKMNLLQRINYVQTKVAYVQKDKKPGMRYSVVLHDAVTGLVRPAMVEAGVLYTSNVTSVRQDGNRTEVDVAVTFRNIDDPEDTLTVTMIGYGIDDQDKGPGKAISYAVKYALLKTLGLETGDDPDENQEAKHETSGVNVPRRETPRPPEMATQAKSAADAVKDAIMAWHPHNPEDFPAIRNQIKQVLGGKPKMAEVLEYVQSCIDNKIPFNTAMAEGE